MIYDIELPKNTAQQYLDNLINRVYKILPLFEEKNETVFKYVDSLIFEIDGTITAFDNVYQSDKMLSVMAILESISTELYYCENFNDENIIKPEVFQCISVIRKINEEIARCDES